jgi:hypothetical protein
MSDAKAPYRSARMQERYERLSPDEKAALHKVRAELRAEHQTPDFRAQEQAELDALDREVEATGGIMTTDGTFFPVVRPSTIEWVRQARTFDELCARVPLRPIRSDPSLCRAIELKTALCNRRGLSADGQDYVEVLTGLIEAYEGECHALDGPAPTAARTLKFLIEDARRMTYLGRLAATGIAEAALREMADGKRATGVDAAQALGRYFDVQPGEFTRSASNDG